MVRQYSPAHRGDLPIRTDTCWRTFVTTSRDVREARRIPVRVEQRETAARCSAAGRQVWSGRYCHALR